MKTKTGIIIFMLFMGVILVEAVEVAPRITDREIIESLAELKAGQQVLSQRFGQVDQRFEQMNQRFEQVDVQIGRLHSTMTTMFGVLSALIISMFGYMI